MELHKLIEELQKEGVSPEEVLKAVKQRKYTLQKIKEYQRKTYKKITVSVRKDDIQRLKKHFPNIDENYLAYSIAVYKLASRIPNNVWEPLWEKTLELFKN